MSVEITLVDYLDQQQSKLLVSLLDAYARDPMGGGEPLPAYARDHLPQFLAGFPGAFSLIARADGQPAGFCNCQTGFSSFYAQPLINIHDLAVLPDFRGRRISQRLLEAVEQQARERGCCKITLEVLTGNEAAKVVYRRHGFKPYQLDPTTGVAEYWHHTL